MRTRLQAEVIRERQNGRRLRGIETSGRIGTRFQILMKPLRRADCFNNRDRRCVQNLGGFIKILNRVPIRPLSQSRGRRLPFGAHE